jgi:2-amino-4-hydroxy-6-hydroxymethyldihydropteridine diphosphokinase
LTTAFVGLGANLGDREATIRAALVRLAAAPGVRVAAVSRLRETEPVGGPPGQPRFLNGVARLETTLAARALLDLLLATEAALGRIRGAAVARWGPRPIDLDLLVFGEERIDEPGLAVPHPRILERAFVMEPLAELAPEVLDALRRGR